MLLEHGFSEALCDSYELEDRVLGRGGFGTVRLARLRNAKHMVRAVKEVRKVSLHRECLIHREIEVLRRLDHPCICRLLETFEDQKSIHLVLEYIDGRELFDEIEEDILKKEVFDERRAACIMRQVFNALQYCHSRSVIHRDLKPENIMVLRAPGGASLTEPRIKIIDFGLAVLCKSRSEQRSKRLEGTLPYLAPETRDGTVIPASDLWSVGVILHVILMGRFPQMVGSKVHGLRSTPLSAEDLVGGLLQTSVELRLTAQQAAAHPWTRATPAELPCSGQAHSYSVDAFKTFQKSAKLRQAALTAIAIQLSGQQVQALRDQFLAVDADGSGGVSRQELLNAVLADPPDGISDVEEWVDSIFDSIDADASGEIEFTEWEAAALQDLKLLSEEAMLAAFRVFDLDNDGAISKEELARVIAHTPEEVADWIPQFDLDGDGEISFEEFKALVSQQSL